MRDLTKWPRLLVVGEDVTYEQANEILVRTDSWHLSTNDRDFRRQICTEFGIGMDDYGMPRWQEVERFSNELGGLDLHYLHNAQIVSAWIGGPHGWCGWGGIIGCSTYNLGKWPGSDEVTADWQTIAQAFPFLNLRAQLVTDEGSGDLAIGWEIANGQVKVDEDPARQVCVVREEFPFNIFVRGGERGVSIERLKAAVEQVKASASNA